MNSEFKKLLLTFLFGLFSVMVFAQINLPKVPKPVNFTPQTLNNIIRQNNSTLPNTDFGIDKRQQQQNARLIQQADARIQQQFKTHQQIYKDISQTIATRNINYNLPNKNHIESTKHYRKAFDIINQFDPNNFSLKQATFLIENAYYEEKENYNDFNKVIKQIGDFLREKMNELGYDKSNNIAKNYMLFQFFSDTLEIKSKGLKHLPFKYDFEDYQGKKDWSKMFVSKLLRTGKGQCNSMPRLYLILAEEIGAEAFLSFSPNHSYIKFRDSEENWYNVELTNGMFTTDTFILQSGYIKSEALQNGIYMQQLSKKQLLSQLFSNLAIGYTQKFGYDEFINQVIEKALELYPNNIFAHMLKSNYLTHKFENATKQVGVNPRNQQELQNIRYFPKMVSLLNEVNKQYDKTDNLGFEFMPADAYEKWLSSLKNSKEKKKSEQLKKQFNLKLKPTFKN